MRARLRLVVLVAAGCCAAWAMTETAAAAGAVLVNQVNRAFSEKSITVARGSVVRFLNADKFLHQVYVTSPTFKFESGEQEPGKSVDVTFSVDGTFAVRCEIHPKMTLMITVN